MARHLTERRCVAPLILDDDDCHEGNSVRKMPYLKLPQSQFRLSVLKLDGSVFDVHVERNVTVAELRQAVEKLFMLSPTEGHGKISWAHVWGYFCLCYDGQKLINDKTHIRDFRMQDGDQLQFSRHMSFDYLHLKRGSKTQIAACQHSRFYLGSDTCEENKHTVLRNKENLESQHERPSSGSNADEKDDLGMHEHSYNYYQHLDQEEVHVPKSKLAHFLRGLSPYSKLQGLSRTPTEGKFRPSRFALPCLGSPRPEGNTTLRLITNRI